MDCQSVVDNCGDMCIVKECTRYVEARCLPLRQSTSSSIHNVCCVVKLDREEIFRTTTTFQSSNPFFGDEFHYEVPRKFRLLSFYLFDQYSGRIARHLGRITFRKQDIVKYSGSERWYHLKPLNRHLDVTGKICLELSFVDDERHPGSARRLHMRDTEQNAVVFDSIGSDCAAESADAPSSGLLTDHAAFRSLTAMFFFEITPRI
ncbi:unnamed protein product [Soboliphyme baturini]|uniref:C2 domain-containing protein n=1 Tax=Soboliphyme baturini TaxID=241478 RepID=A0A183IXC1_9BILA|nr:unnamed protein product [Soboliphyme baturini]